MPNIPNFTIGTNLDEVKNYLNYYQQVNQVNQQAAQSLFNFIEEDKSIGDGKITNTIELTMINGFLANAMRADKQSFFGQEIWTNNIHMPEPIQLDDENVTFIRTHRNHGILIKVVNNETVEHYDYHPLDTNYKVVTDGNIDCMVDKDKDGIADFREVNILKKNGDREVYISYVDRNLDGTFEEKKVESLSDGSEYVRATYRKDITGHWRQVGGYM